MEKLQKLIPVFIVTGVLGLLTIIGISMYVNINNTEIENRERVIAQQKNCEANFDKMFKVISQLAQIPERFADKSKEAFKEIYPQLMNGRYQGDKNSLMKWVTESNPTYDMKAVGVLYEKLAVAIESNREEFFIEQQKLIDYKRVHSTYTKKWPNSWFVSDTSEVKINIVTSETTKEAFKTGEENNIELFE